MRRLVLLLLGSALMLLAATTEKIDRQISQAQQEIEARKNALQNVNMTMDELGKSIVVQQENLKKLEGKLANLSRSIEKDKALVSQKERQKESLLKARRETLDQRNELEQKLIKAIINDLAFSEILGEQGEVASEYDILQKEALSTLRTIVIKESDALKESFYNYVMKVEAIEEEIKTISGEIQILRDSKNRIQELQAQQKADLERLNREKTLYKKRITVFLQEQEESRRLLSSLSKTKEEILAEEQRRKAAEEAARKQAEADAQRKSSIAPKNDLEVKLIGSSYFEPKTTHYKRGKVDPPLKDFTITIPFGKYHDPVYNFDFYSDSITMRPKQNNAIVRNILDGKISMADYNAITGNTVVVEHPGKLQTVYKKLEQISPNIKKGHRIRKGDAVGRAGEEFRFQVEYNGALIDPLELIRM